MSDIKTEEELTTSYLNNTLKEGYYWFSSGNFEFIGRLKYPTNLEIAHRKKEGLPEPKKIIAAMPGLFVGELKTISVLCPIPSAKQIRSMSK